MAGTRGGLQHLTVEWFRKKSSAKLNMIHYPGPAQAMNDFLTGRVPMMMQTLAPVAGDHRVWRGETAGGRLGDAAAELSQHANGGGDTAGLRLVGLVDPGGAEGYARDIVEKINRDLRTALARPDIVGKIEQQGNYTRPMSPQQLAEFVRRRAHDLGADRQGHRSCGGALSFDDDRGSSFDHSR